MEKPKPATNQKIMSIIKKIVPFILILIIVIMYDNFGIRGFFLTLLMEIAMIVVVVFSNKTLRDPIITQYKLIETSIYGKPLDRKDWTDEEWKNRTRIVLWRFDKCKKKKSKKK